MSVYICDLLLRLDTERHCKPWTTAFSGGLLPTDLPLASGRSQLPVALSVDLLLAAGEHVLRRDVADGTVQADVVVMPDVRLHQTQASPSESGVPGRMHSLFNDLCQRSIFPFDWG